MTALERGREAVEAWDARQDGSAGYVPGILVCIEIIRELCEDSEKLHKIREVLNG